MNYGRVWGRKADSPGKEVRILFQMVLGLDIQFHISWQLPGLGDSLEGSEILIADQSNPTL
jgi:hypothetical protein